MHKRQFHSFLSVLIIAICIDLIAPVALATRYPGYSHLHDTISTLGTSRSPVQQQQGAALAAVGGLLLVFAVGQALAFQKMRWSHVLFLLGITLFGIGSILAGIFPEDPSDVEETISGKIHGIASGIGFLFLMLNPLWALWIDEFGRLKVLNAILFPAAILPSAAFLLSESRTTGILRYTGLFQRLNLCILYGNLLLNYLWQQKRPNLP
ncbi:MAG: DUF998 domain-containing protein [Oscillochloridaceae bacterium]|nr:DUF998 domain-containing protein [Chloroflexaceae bacterium]MDW8389803.1 DUF998 domain-containing protein [Oscillochloridaceae bacterium]